MVHLTPDITVTVHAVDTQAHPTVPAGWRWAVQVGGTPPAELDYCANAGWCPTEPEAWLEGEMVGAAAAKALRMFGIPVRYQRLPLDHDPIPAGGDRLGLPA